MIPLSAICKRILPYRTGTICILICCILMPALMAASGAQGQVLGPGLARGRTEMGYAHGWFRRDLRSELSSDFDWEVDLLYLRYGVAERLTVSAEGFIWKYEEGGRYPDRKYRTYHVGCGFFLRIREIRSIQFGLMANYSERFWFDTSRSRYHKRTSSVVAAILARREFQIAGKVLTVWGGPAYIFDRLVEYPWGSQAGTQYDSFDNFGCIFGLDSLLMDHIHIAAFVAYADYLQPRVTSGYRF